MFEFLVLMTLDHREVLVNPRYIVSIAEAKDVDDPGRHYTDKVKCAVAMVDGKQITTAESCEDIEKRLLEIMEKRIKELRK